MDLLNMYWTTQLSGLAEGKRKGGGEKGPFHCTGTQNQALDRVPDKLIEDLFRLTSK